MQIWCPDQVDQMLFDPTCKSPGSLFETQQPQIYTLNADSNNIHVFLTWCNNRLCSFTNRGELWADSLRGLPKLGKWLCFGINLSLLTPGLSTSSSTPYERHISHSHPYRMASRLRMRGLISTFPLAPMNHPHHQPCRSSSLLQMRSCLPRQYSA